MEYFQHLTYWHWFALGVVLALLDVTFGANFLFVWCGLSAAIVGVCLWAIPQLSWEWQFIIFGIEVFMSFVAWRLWLNKLPKESSQPFLNRRSAQYIGQEYTLTAAIVDGRGIMKVGDTQWRIEGDNCPAGTRVKVVAVEGVILKVKRL